MRTEIPKSQQYIESLCLAESATKLKSREFARELGLDRISLSSAEGALLTFLVRLHGGATASGAGAKIVEIGTLTGLSAQYLIEGTDAGGKVWTLEKSEVHAAKAVEAWSEHPRASDIHAVVGDARATLAGIEANGPFDLLFIDGNKAAYGDYLAWGEKNVRAGGLIIADNVFLSGAVWGESTTQKFNEKQIRVLQEFNRRLADPALYDSVLVPTLEGLFVAMKKF
jgi:predicted O-methyltransferase YrrM